MITRSEKNKKINSQLVKEEISKKTKKVTTTLLKVLAVFLIISTLFFLYMRFLGTSGIIVREYGIVNKNLPNEFNGLKIVHISDLYYGYSVHKDKLNKTVDLINKIKPDIIVFTGDLVNKNATLTETEEEELIEALNKMNATIGKFCIRGDNDNKVFDYIIGNTNFKLMENSSETIYSNGLNPILLVGLDNANDIEKSFSIIAEQNLNPNIYSIVLVHKPDLTKDIMKYKPSLILAGHSLNGSIKLPKIGGIIKPNGAKTYYDEKYTINDTTLYISGGIGTNNFNLRLFNRPSFNFYRIRNK